MRLMLPATLTLCLVAAAFGGENWPDFRGPAVDGHADDARLPLTFSATQHVTWKTALPGKAYSSPVIWGTQVWLTTASPDGKTMSALCVDKQTGKLLHNIKLLDNEKPEPINDANSYASPSPVIESGRVYLHFGTYGTFCLDTVTGKELWRRTDIKLDHKEGPGSSPLLHKNLLILTCDGMDVQYVTALDKLTGKTVWKTDRSHDLSSKKPDLRKTYSTPIVINVDGREQLISQGAFCVYAYDPMTGKELWRLPDAGFSTVSRPHYEDGLLFVNTGFTKPQLWAIKPTGSGVLEESKAVVWKQLKNVPRKPSEVFVNGMLFMVDDSGIVSCIDAKTGSEAYRERIDGKYSASPIASGDRIYLFSETGECTVIKADRKFQVLATSKLPHGMWATPAVSGNALFIRTLHDLYRIEQK